MRTILSGMAILAFSAASLAAAGAQTTPNSSGAAPIKTMSPMMHGGSMPSGSAAMMPKCRPSSNYVVWYVASTKMYYTRSNAMFGTGTGKYVCRSAAIAAHAKMARAHAMSHGTMGGAMGGAKSGGAMGATGDGGASTVPGAGNAPNPGAGGTSSGPGVPAGSSPAPK